MERKLYESLHKRGTFICFEVTIGWYGKERVDCLTYDTKGVWRCYEIKVTKSDFHSKAKKTFIGHYNYYVMTRDLYEQVKDEIPNNIGVYIDGNLIKKAKKQELNVDEQILKDSMIRSLYRESEKLLKIENPNVINNLKQKINYYKELYVEYYNKYYNLLRKMQNKYDYHCDREE